MRIAEKNLERRAKRCHRPRWTDADADAVELAVAMLTVAAQVVIELLGSDLGHAPAMTCGVAIDAIDSGWMTPAHALRFAHAAIERAAAC